MKIPRFRNAIILPMALAWSMSSLAQNSPILRLPDGFAPTPPADNGAPGQTAQVPALPPGITMLSGDSIPAARSMYLLMRQIVQREELNEGNGKSFLIGAGNLSESGADRFIEAAVAAYNAIDEENRAQREALCRDRSAYDRSEAALRTFFINSELALEERRRAAPAGLARELEPGDYAKLTEFARSVAGGTTVTSVDWKTYLEATTFNAEAVVSSICGLATN